MQKYSISSVIKTVASYIESDTADITFYNTGTNMLYVNGVRLPPNYTLEIEGQMNQLDITKYNISFVPIVTGGIPGYNEATIIRKIYSN